MTTGHGATNRRAMLGSVWRLDRVWLNYNKACVQFYDKTRWREPIAEWATANRCVALTLSWQRDMTTASSSASTDHHAGLAVWCRNMMPGSSAAATKRYDRRLRFWRRDIMTGSSSAVTSLYVVFSLTTRYAFKDAFSYIRSPCCVHLELTEERYGNV